MPGESRTMSIAPHKSLQVSFGGYSTAGIKAQNQDAFAAHRPLSNKDALKGVVAALADGLSTSERSDEASQLAVTHFISDYLSTPDSWSVRDSASRVLNGLNSWLYSNGGEANALVTTFSCAIVKSTVAHLFHIGDSRIYLHRQGRLEQLTSDHVLQHGTQSSLTRALGAELRLQVDYQAVELAPDDELLLTSDGVHDVLRDEQLQQLLTSTGNLEQRAEQIANHALQSGSQDNVSCLIMQICQLAEETIDVAQDKITRQVIPPVMQEGNRIDDFIVQRVLYAGTRSHLYLVTDSSGQYDQPLMLKAPSANFEDDANYLEAFVREQWIGLRINHRNVMRAFPRPTQSAFLYNLFEYVEGIDLRQWMLDTESPALGQVRVIVTQLIGALRVLHRQGMVHRDLKPENILIDAQGQIKLIDFGTVHVAGLSEAAQMHEDYPVGSVNYIAPEYLLGYESNYRSDLFSLGVITYEMLAGQLPFKERSNTFRPSSLQDWRYRSIRERRPDIPVWVDLCLEKATAADGRKRYQVLSEYLTDLSKPNPAMLRLAKSGPLLERNPILFWQLLSAALAAVILLQLVI